MSEIVIDLHDDHVLIGGSCAACAEISKSIRAVRAEERQRAAALARSFGLKHPFGDAPVASKGVRTVVEVIARAIEADE